MLEIIGAIALTLLLGWCALYCFMFATFCYLGFDEVNIPAGIVLTLIGIIPCVLWWWLVGSHLHIDFT